MKNNKKENIPRNSTVGLTEMYPTDVSVSYEDIEIYLSYLAYDSLSFFFPICVSSYFHFYCNSDIINNLPIH